jgi:DNA (cytosine-5)-methyltransferase 1
MQNMTTKLKTLRFIDLFAGVGGFRLGLERANLSLWNRLTSQGDGGIAPLIEGVEPIQPSVQYPRDLPNDLSDGDAGAVPYFSCVYSNEWDKYANSIYKQHFGECDLRDITTVYSGDIPDHDLLLGGFPCQSFSVAGKRGGFEDTRGTMFFEIARILRDKRPRYLLLENVKGLLTHDDGKTFQTILKVLTDLGYDVQWQVLNSKNFGVPQNRERVFIIGHLRGEPRPQVFPLSESDRRYLTSQGKSQSEGQRIRGNNPPDYAGALRVGGGDTKDLIATTLAARDYKGGGNLIQLNNPTHSNDRVYAPEGVSPTLNTMQGGRRQPFVAIPVLTPDRQEKRQNGRRFKEDGEPSFTLTAQDRHGVMTDDLTIRRLTPMECERLQGFPDGWTLPLSDTQRYKTLGNAVTVNVIEVVGGKLLDSIYQNMLSS